MGRMYLDRLLESYAAGQTSMDEGRNPVNSDIVAAEIVNRYRPYLNDKNGVSHDGPLSRDIKAALEAAEKRGEAAAFGPIEVAK